MKKLALLLVLVLVFSVAAVGCGAEEKPADNTGDNQNQEDQNNDENSEGVDLSKLEDGIYFAQETEFSAKSGWKYLLVLEVKDGKIVDVNWTGAHMDGGTDKKTRAADGEYGMIDSSEIGKEWHEQAEAVEAFLLEKQDLGAITLNDDGKTDVIAGASVRVNSVVELAQKAFAVGPVERGPYKDGAYYAEEDSFSEKSGWKSTVSITVINGYIVVADWDAVHKDGGDTKDVQSLNGEYGMKEVSKIGKSWYEQATVIENHLLQTQDPTDIELNDDGKTDAVAGASIRVGAFFKLAEEALEAAK